MDTYRAYYNDASTDPYNGVYLDILNEYDPTANQPQDLRAKVYNSGNAGRAMSHLLLVRDPNQPGTGPGKVIAYHRATRHDARIGQATPFDGIGYAFIGDVHNAQPPITVVLPDDLFNSAQVVQVPTAARIDQLLAADNTLELIGPFTAGDPDIEGVTVRRIVYVPPRYLLMALDTSLTPRQAWNQIRGAIVADNHEADCLGLIDWLRVSLTRRAANDQPRTTVVPPEPQVLTDPQYTRTFLSYRLQVLHMDLPELSPSAVGAGAQAIATNIADLTDEARRTREEADARRLVETNKTPRDFYGPALNRLMRLAQVSNESSLQPIHTQLAKAKKALQRKTLQSAVDVALEQLDYHQECQMTASMAKKIIELEYTSNLENNFTVGLHIFCTGPLDPESIENQRQLIAQTDAMMSSTAAASLSDVVTILDPQGDVSIPRTMAELRYNIEKFHAIMVVAFGANHALVTKIKEFYETLIRRERKLGGHTQPLSEATPPHQ